MLRLATSSSSLRDGLQRIGALLAEGGSRGKVLWDAGAGGEGGVGRVSFAVEVVDAVGGPGIRDDIQFEIMASRYLHMGKI